MTTTTTTTTLELPASAAAMAPAGERMLAKSDFWAGVGLAAVSAAVTFDAWHSIAEIGLFHEEFSYILLAPVMIAWIAMHNARRWTTCRARNGWVGLVLLGLGWAAFAYGFSHDPAVWRAGAVVMAVGAFLSAAGTDALWRFLPVFGACLFLIPVAPNGRYRLAEPLQVATAQATQGVCDVLGIYVDRAGNLLSINGVDVTVAEACNGMRMVMTLFLVCYLVAFTSDLKWGVRVMLLAVSPLVAIVANVVRLVPTVYLFGHLSREAAESFHTWAGWGMIVVSFLVLMGGAMLVQRVMTMDAKPGGGGGGGGAGEAKPKEATVAAGGGR